MSMQRMGVEHSSQALGVNPDGDWLWKHKRLLCMTHNLLEVHLRGC